MGEGEPPLLEGPWRDRLGRWAIRSLQVLLLLALLAVTARALIEIQLVIVPVIVALIVASAFSPAIAWLRSHRFPPILAAWTVLLVAVASLGGIITFVVLAIRAQWDELAAAGVAAHGQLVEWARDLPPPFADLDWEDVRERITEAVTSPRFGVGAVAGVTAAVSVVTGAALFIVLLFFFLKDGDRIWRFFLKPLDGPQLERAERIGGTSVKVLGGYLRGTAIIALVESVVIGVALAILGVPLALPLASIVFLGAFIPLAGGILAGTFAALVALVTEGAVIALVVVAVAVAVNQLEGDLLQPVIMAQTVSLHPLAVLVALTAGTVVSGIVGALLAVPLTAVAWAIIKQWDGPAEPPPEPKPGRLAKLFARRRKSASL